MRQLDAVEELLKRASSVGALFVRVQLEEHFVVEAQLAPLIPKKTLSEEKEKEDIAFFSS